MKRRIALAAAALVAAFATAHSREARMPVPEALRDRPALQVSGRQGWKSGQVIRFGTFATSAIDRSWTKSVSGQVEILRGEGKKQRFAFTVRDRDADLAKVSCIARVGTFGVAAAGAEINAKDRGKLRCTLEPAGGPAWSLVLEEWFERPLKGTLTGATAAFEVVGTDRLEGTRLRSGFTTGFHVLSSGTAIAAVQTLNDGAVWTVEAIPPERRPAIVATLAALLAFEDLRNLPDEPSE